MENKIINGQTDEAESRGHIAHINKPDINARVRGRVKCKWIYLYMRASRGEGRR